MAHEAGILLGHEPQAEQRDGVGQQGAGPVARRAVLQVADGQSVEGVVQIQLGRLVHGQQHQHGGQRGEQGREQLEAQVAQRDVTVQAHQAQ
eukprot:scaffold69_cov248-Pinguiococcus_pyrenoidosus.AAC.35